MIGAIQTALSGLVAATKKVEAGASNIANLQTTGSLDDPGNAPYTPLTTAQKTLSAADGSGLGVQSEFIAKRDPFTPAYDPDSPFANEDGLIGVPNVNLAEEAINLNMAATAYKANLAVIKTTTEMQDELLRTFDGKA